MNRFIKIVLFFYLIFMTASSANASWKIALSDRFVPPNKRVASPGSINLGTEGRIFVSGWNFTDPESPFQGNGVLRFSPDNGKTWKTAKVIPHYLLFRSVALKNNHILLHGARILNSGKTLEDFQSESIIMNPQGKLKTVDRFRLHPKGPSLPNDAFISSKGYLYTSMALKDESDSHPNSIYHWTVRRSIDQGRTWKTIDDFECGSDPETCVQSAFGEDMHGNIFLTGWWATPEKPNITLTTRKLKTNSAHWTLSDLHTTSHNKDSVSRDIFTDDTRKTLYTVGFHGEGERECLLRRSTNFGKTWETHLSIKDPRFLSCDMQSGDQKGNLIVIAGGVLESRNPHKGGGIIKVSEDGGKTWSENFFFPGEDKSDFFFKGVLILNSKEVLLLGMHLGINPMKHESNWYVYRFYKE